MSRQHIQSYRRRLDKLKAASGGLNERPLSDAFRDLLDRWGGSQNLTLIPQWEGKGTRGNDIRVNGALIPSTTEPLPTRPERAKCR